MPVVAPSHTTIPSAPGGKEKIKWLGPGFLWMVSAAGSGELLFSPRVGSLYGYTLLWALIAAVILKWFINREIGRFTVCTGASILDGFSMLSERNNWPLYLILVPQLFVAVSTIAGLAGSGATALILLFPGDIRLWAVASILLSSMLVLWGKFRGVELTATILALLLALASVIAAILIFPDTGELAKGLVPSVPPDINYGEILPWLGFMLSGAAGMIWYSYWVQRKGYGMAGVHSNKEVKEHRYSKTDIERLKGWIKHMTLDNNIAVFGTLAITIGFLVLGVELLRPMGLVPEENRVAEVLGQLLGQLWGPVGFWFMITGVFIGFWSTVLSDQDGFGRMFSRGIRIIAEPLKLPAKWKNEAFLKKMFVIVVVTVLPIILYLVAGEPVSLLKIAGFIEAAHIPVLAGLVVYLNQKKLPKELRPNKFTVIMTVIAGLFFAVFAVIYILQLTHIMSLS